MKLNSKQQRGPRASLEHLEGMPKIQCHGFRAKPLALHFVDDVTNPLPRQALALSSQVMPFLRTQVASKPSEC